MKKPVAAVFVNKHELTLTTDVTVTEFELWYGKLAILTEKKHPLSDAVTTVTINGVDVVLGWSHRSAFVEHDWFVRGVPMIPCVARGAILSMLIATDMSSDEMSKPMVRSILLASEGLKVFHGIASTTATGFTIQDAETREVVVCGNEGERLVPMPPTPVGVSSREI